MHYTETKTYRDLDEAGKKAFAAHQKAHHLADEQALLLFRLEDLRHLSAEEKNRGNRLAQMLVLSSMAVFLTASATKNAPLLLAASILVIVSSIIYFTGAFNPITREIRMIKKELKKFPQIAEEWGGEQK